MRDIARGQAVQVELGRHGSWTARVEAVMADRIAVAALARLPAGADLAGLSGHVAIATAKGILRTQAIVVAADRGGLVELELTEELEIDQRREHVRVAASVPGVVAPRSESHAPLHTFTLDVSGGGLLIAGAGPAEIGTVVELTLKLPERDPLRSEARIARRTESGHVGLVFHAIAEREREALVRWIFERQRLERAALKEGLDG
jgi:PilZ domain